MTLATTESAKDESPGGPIQAPTVSIPKGDGAIRVMGEKFATNPVTGSAAFSSPIPASPGRNGFGPAARTPL